MNILLINPWVYDFACYDLFNKPLGLLEIAALLKESGFSIELIDAMDRFDPWLEKFLGESPVKFQKRPCGNYYSEEVPKPPVFKAIPRKYKRHGMPPDVFIEKLSAVSAPDIILVTSGMTYWYEGVFEVISILKAEFPGVPVVLGGIYATLCHDHAMKHSGADHVYMGTDLAGIASLLSGISGREVKAAREYYSPAYELYPKLEYATLRTSNGCPYRCSYCAWHLLNPKYRRNDPESVVNEISRIQSSFGVNDFAFYDEALLYHADEHIIPIIKGLMKKGVKARFHTPNGLHARYVTERLARFFKECNFVEPRLGFESADRSRQDDTGGKVSNEDLGVAITALQSAGYSTSQIGVNILIGLPGQSVSEVEESIRFANTFKVRVHLEEYSPVPGTAYYTRCGIPADADPLIHNNSAFPLHGPEKVAEFERLKELNQKLNKEIKCSIIKCK
jgi:hypothetical protein